MKKSKILFIIPVLIFIILSCFYYFYNKKIELSGIIESTQAEINSEVSGKIVETKKNEGDYLTKDEIIAVIDSSGQEKIIRELEKNIIQKKAKLSGKRNISYSEELEMAKANIENIRKNLVFWTDKYNRVNKMFMSGKIADSEFLDVKIKLNTVKEQLALAEKQYEQIKKKPVRQTNSSLKSDLEKVAAELELQKLILLKYKIKSPIDGVYSSKRINAGDLITAGSNIGIVTNPDDLWVKFNVPGKYQSYILNCGKLDLILNSDKNIKINGEIIGISEKPDQNNSFGIKVKIVDNKKEIKQGMKVSMKIKKKSLTIFSMLKSLFNFT